MPDPDSIEELRAFFGSMATVGNPTLLEQCQALADGSKLWRERALKAEAMLAMHGLLDAEQQRCQPGFRQLPLTKDV